MAGHGGGAWKVAYADFVTAMMAFFLVMWITSQSKPVKQAIAKYFNDPWGTSSKASGPTGLLPSGINPRDALHASAKAKTPAPPPPPRPDPNSTLIKGKLRTRSQVTVHKLGDETSVGGAVYFDEPTTELSPPQQARLAAMAADLAGKSLMIDIIGHVSNRPLPEGAAYKDRADLTYARCTRIADALASMKIDQQRLRLVISRADAPDNRSASADSKFDSRVDVRLTDRLVPGADAVTEGQPP
jgi:chemotaxis protein MotB